MNFPLTAASVDIADTKCLHQQCPTAVHLGILLLKMKGKNKIKGGKAEKKIRVHYQITPTAQIQDIAPFDPYNPRIQHAQHKTAEVK